MDKRLIFASLVVCLLTLPLAQARTLHCGAGDVLCLIGAMNTTNTDGQANRIILEAGTSLLTAVDHDDEGPMGLPTVFGTLMIQGAGMGQTVLLVGAVARGPLRGRTQGAMPRASLCTGERLHFSWPLRPLQPGTGWSCSEQSNNLFPREGRLRPHHTALSCGTPQRGTAVTHRPGLTSQRR
jgi:hypothetical protein